MTADNSKSRPNYNWNQCSNGCSCQKPEIVTCNSGNLDVIPQDLSPFVTKLDLRNNRILHVDSVINSYIQMQYLILSANKISLLSDLNFNSLNRLIDLELSSNSISRISQQAFSGLIKLNKLDLSNNKLEELKGPIFSYCIELVHLDLSGNKLSVLPSDVFNGLRSLQV